MHKNIHNSLKFAKKQKKELLDFLDKQININEIKLGHKFLFSKWFWIIFLLGFICAIVPGIFLIMIRNNSWERFNKYHIQKFDKNKIFEFFTKGSKFKISLKKINKKNHYFNDFFIKKPSLKIKWHSRNKKWFTFYKNWVGLRNIHSSNKLNNFIISELEVECWNKYINGRVSFRYIFLVNESKKINKKFQNFDMFLKLLSFNSKNEDISGEFFSGTIKNIFLKLFKKKKYFLKNKLINIKSNNTFLFDQIFSIDRQNKINAFLKMNKGNWRKDFRFFITNQRMYTIQSSNFLPFVSFTNLLWTKPANSKKKIIKNIYKNTIVYLDKILHAQEFINLFDDLFE